MKTRIFLIAIILLLGTGIAKAQTKPVTPQTKLEAAVGAPLMLPPVTRSRAFYRGDSIQRVTLHDITIPSTPLTASDYRLIRNIKRTLPLAKQCRIIMVETYEYCQTLPNKKARQRHMKRVEQDIKQQYGPVVRKLNRTQGKLLIKLIDRETNSSSYDIVKAFLGPVRAGFYQGVAWLFGMSMRKTYDPQGRDRRLEVVVRMVESGQI